tara:strand:+ start:29693 stop:30736 length:1044 start_codon:yes stop_codon:yes gene_type:complete
MLKKDLSRILINPDDTLEEAIQALNSGGMRIVIVIDQNSKLLGIITDGDIRAALLEHKDMQTKAKEFMNSKPYLATEDESKEFILEKMHEKNILAVPIIDSKGRIKALETIHETIKTPTIENPVILMAGGYGKRLHPLTHETPKPLLKVGSEPILETIIKQLADFGFYNFFISTHYKSKMISDYFKDGSKLNVKIDYIHEKEPMGTAGTLTLLPEEFSKLPIILMNGDLATELDFKSLLRNHNESNSSITICVVEYDFQVPYGVIEMKKSKVKNIVEKPTHKFFVNAGIYIINPEVIAEFKDPSYLDMTDLLKDRIEKGNGINIFPLYEKWIDIGRITELNKANNHK